MNEEDLLFMRNWLWASHELRTFFLGMDVISIAARLDRVID
jgi:hypothetical protein